MIHVRMDYSLKRKNIYTYLLEQFKSSQIHEKII